jgi:hypothetical protein
MCSFCAGLFLDRCLTGDAESQAYEYDMQHRIVDRSASEKWYYFQRRIPDERIELQHGGELE